MPLTTTRGEPRTRPSVSPHASRRPPLSAAVAIAVASLAAAMLWVPVARSGLAVADPFELTERVIRMIQIRWGAEGFAVLQIAAAVIAGLAATVLIADVTSGWRRTVLALTVVVMAAPALRDPRLALGLALLSVALRGTWRSSVDRRPRWALPALSWVGALVHPVWMVAPLLGFLLTLGAAGDPPLSGGAGRIRLRRLAVPTTSVAVVLLTPGGLGALVAPVAAVQRGLAALTVLPTHSVRDPGVAVALLLLGAVWLAWHQSHRRPDRGLLACWTLGLVLALVSPVALAAAAPAIALLAGRTLEDHFPRAPRGAHAGAAPAWRRVLPAAAVALVAVVGLAPAIQRGAARAGLEPTLRGLSATDVLITPTSVVPWLDRTGTPATLMSGVAPGQPAGARLAASGALAVHAGWDSTLRDRGATRALVPPDSALATAVQEQWGWTVLAAGDDLVLVGAP